MMMGKKRFAGSVIAEGTATEAHRYGSNHVSTHTRTWDVGVEVHAYVDFNGKIKFDIWTTGGSNDPSRKMEIGCLTENGDFLINEEVGNGIRHNT